MRSLRLLFLLSALALSSQATALEIGRAAPSLSGVANDGRMLSLSQFKGQVVYVDFWASWCAPCRAAIPALEVLYQRYRARGLVVVGVNVDSERKSAQRMLDQLTPTFPIVFDPDGKWPEAFGLRDMPSSYLIDATGVLRYVNTGYRERDAERIEAAIKDALGEKP